MGPSFSLTPLLGADSLKSSQGLIGRARRPSARTAAYGQQIPFGTVPALNTLKRAVRRSLASRAPNLCHRVPGEMRSNCKP